jgi:hypothetical protein
VEWASPNADPKTWTAEIKTKNGLLLSRAAVSKHLDAMRVGAQLYGMEATIEGRLVERKGALCLAVSGSKDVLQLASLTRKVQWDVAANKEYPLDDDEKTAFERLKKLPFNSKTLLRITGMLTAPTKNSLPTLEVRSFQTHWVVFEDQR